MFPVALDLTRISVLLIGSGELLRKRQLQLQENGATQVTVVEIPSPVGGGLGWGHSGKIDGNNAPHPTSPLLGEGFRNAGIVMIAGLDRQASEQLSAQARSYGKLVNVEDVNDLCDFYFTANVRRGDLIIAVSTSGASPTLARKVRDTIGETFGPEWGAYTSELGELRRQWKAQGLSLQEVARKSEEHIAAFQKATA